MKLQPFYFIFVLHVSIKREFSLGELTLLAHQFHNLGKNFIRISVQICFNISWMPLTNQYAADTMARFTPGTWSRWNEFDPVYSTNQADPHTAASQSASTWFIMWTQTWSWSTRCDQVDPDQVSNANMAFVTSMHCYCAHVMMHFFFIEDDHFMLSNTISLFSLKDDWFHRI